MKTQQLQHRKLINAARITLLIQQIVEGKALSKAIGKPEGEAAKAAKDLVWHNINIHRETVKQLAIDQANTKELLYEYAHRDSKNQGRWASALRDLKSAGLKLVGAA
jgi:hypothetical protein